MSLRTIPGFAQSRRVAALKLLDLLSELLQLGITNTEHLRASAILITFAFHASLRKSMFLIIFETKRSRVHCKSNQAGLTGYDPDGFATVDPDSGNIRRERYRVQLTAQ
jgi:hypothetical protein